MSNSIERLDAEEARIQRRIRMMTHEVLLRENEMLDMKKRLKEIRLEKRWLKESNKT